MNSISRNSGQHISPIFITFADTENRAGEHPLKYVLLDNKNGFIFARGLEDSLSNETRKAKIRIEIRYIHHEDIEKYPFKIKLEYQEDERNPDTVDRIEHLSQTKDFVRLNQDQIKDFKVYDKEGNLLSSNKTTELFIWADNNPMVVLNRSKTIKFHERSDIWNR